MKYWCLQDIIDLCKKISCQSLRVFLPSFPWCTANSLNPSHKWQRIQRSDWLRVWSRLSNHQKEWVKFWFPGNFVYRYFLGRQEKSVDCSRRRGKDKYQFSCSQNGLLFNQKFANISFPLVRNHAALRNLDTFHQRNNLRNNNNNNNNSDLLQSIQQSEALHLQYLHYKSTLKKKYKKKKKILSGQ